MTTHEQREWPEWATWMREPWKRVDVSGCRGNDFEVVSQVDSDAFDGLTVIAFQADADRIVACVNACAGIRNVVAVKDVIALAREQHRTCSGCAMCIALARLDNDPETQTQE